MSAGAGHDDVPSDWTSSSALTLVLLGLAGWIDAVGYLQLGRLFVSFMSGNTTQMAVGLGRGEWSGAGHIAGLIALFVLGVFAGTLVAGAAGRWRLPVVLGVETGLLVCALLLPAPAGPLPTAVPVVLAMGVQNAALHRAGRDNMGLTYVTGTLVGLARELAQAVGGDAPHAAWRGHVLLWLAMAAGATAGAASFMALGFRSLALPAAAVGGLAVAGARSVRTASPRR